MSENLEDVVDNALQVAGGFVNLGQYDEAKEVCEKILHLKPDSMRAHFILGCVYQAVGAFSDARIALRKAELLDPENIDVKASLGLVSQCLGQLEEAMAYYLKVLEVQPDHGDALINLGVIYQGAGERSEARKLYQRAVELDSSSVPALINLGAVYVEELDYEGAEALLRKACELEPDSIQALNGFALCLKNQGRLEEARAVSSKVLEQDPHQAHALFGLHLCLPVLHEDEPSIDVVRVNYAQGLQKVREGLALDSAERVLEAADAMGSTTNFCLHYQGRNDLELQIEYAKLCETIMGTVFPQFMEPIALRERKSGEKTRVGFISSYWRHHSIFKTHGAFVTHLCSDDFEVHAIHIGSHCDASSEAIAHSAAKFHHWPDFGLHHVEMLRRLELDVLIYPDYGMEPRLQLIAPLRLAPVQCNMGGHPVTSGLGNMDYFLSSDLMEPQGAEDHYSEKLIRLPGLMSAYPKPDATQAKQPPIDLPSKDSRVSYLCLQSLYKLLPNFDDIYPAIAKVVPQAHFGFIKESSEAVTSVFRIRIEKAFAKHGLDADDYVSIYPRLSQDSFYGLAASADVILDSFLWSGNNSSMEACAFGKPIVTCGGPMMRGRHTLAILQRADVMTTVAKDMAQYVDLAGKLGTDPGLREEIGNRIRDSHGVLFDNAESVRGLESFLKNL
ncbi:MAG: tetratricopeptide repeat protein [Deltaproteobacteria bacterium]|jgi:protein O-GlcNAc transferase|nr:tetratricopeptide repeat protein [Deltaproteobacteria bacterium]MBT6435277.1 tetratricopeptide repeat protein [Deltaproteobacteria bacterium]